MTLRPLLLRAVCALALVTTGFALVVGEGATPAFAASVPDNDTEPVAATGAETLTPSDTVRAFDIPATTGPVLLPEGMKAVEYYHALPTDETSSLRFALGSGSLPLGLRLSTRGVLWGSPWDGQVAEFSILSTDQAGVATTTAFRLTVNSSPRILDHWGRPASRMTLGVASREWRLWVFAVPVPTATLDSGVLPPGMTFSSSGDLTGTPTQAGEFTYTLRMTNKFGYAVSVPYTTVVEAPPVVVDPAGPPAAATDTNVMPEPQPAHRATTASASVGEKRLAMTGPSPELTGLLALGATGIVALGALMMLRARRAATTT